MMKLFVVSDIHSFYDEFIDALTKAGFDEDNPNHLLVVCGDLFDRGPKSRELLNYINSLEHKILIRGNHEDLLEELCERQYPYEHDISNGTVRTVIDLGRPMEDFQEQCDQTWRKVSNLLSSMVDYYETKNYVFVHAWIPVKADSEWRLASKDAWECARWENPFQQKNPEIGKKIVCGHWHCSAGWAKQLHMEEFSNYSWWEPYDGEYFLAIDRCTAFTHKVNVVVIEDELLKEDDR